MNGIKVRALRTGYYADTRLRGDDTLGEGNGDVFTLVDRPLVEHNVEAGKPLKDETGKIQTRVLTAEEQFSVLWMEKVDEDVPEKLTTAQDALDGATEGIKQQKRRRRA